MCLTIRIISVIRGLSIISPLQSPKSSFHFPSPFPKGTSFEVPFSMKKIMCYVTIATLVACNAIDNDNEPDIASYPTGIRATDSVYVERNAEITPANAYSDLFLDTTAVEQYIRTKNVSTADAPAMLNFFELF